MVENHSSHDKYNIKSEFGQDEQGWRGQMMSYTNEEVIRLHEEIFSNSFSKVQVRPGKWKTYYTKEGLIQLLDNTSLIRNFDKGKDKAAIESIAKKYMTNQGIMTEQHRLLITAWK